MIFSNRSCGTSKSVDPLVRYASLVDSYSGQKGSIGVWAALGASSHWRKATTHMWDDYVGCLKARGHVFTPALRAGSYFCGDAAGREDDFAATDYAFAHNIGIRFLVPELVFEGGGARWGRPEDHGCQLEAGYSEDDLLAVHGSSELGSDLHSLMKSLSLAGKNQLFVLMMGAPASGKTTLARSLCAGASSSIHLDEVAMRNFPASLRSAMKGLGLVSPLALVVADATHPTRERRDGVMRDARRLLRPGCATAIVHMTTSPRLCEHLNMARAQPAGDSSRSSRLECSPKNWSIPPSKNPARYSECRSTHRATRRARSPSSGTSPARPDTRTPP